MKLKLILTFLLFCIATSFTFQYDNDPIPLDKLKKMLCNDWLYQYSIKNNKKEVMPNEVFINGTTNVFFRIVFRKMKKKELERFYRNRPLEYINLLNGNVLEGVEMFGDYIGCPEYPILINNSTDIKGNLLDGNIQTYGNCDGSAPPKMWKSFRIDKLTTDTLILSGYMGDVVENKLIYARIK